MFSIFSFDETQDFVVLFFYFGEAQDFVVSFFYFDEPQDCVLCSVFYSFILKPKILCFYVVFWFSIFDDTQEFINMLKLRFTITIHYHCYL